MNEAVLNSPAWKSAEEEASRLFLGYLLGTIPMPEPPPKKEYWMTKAHEMVVVQDDGVHKLLSHPEDIVPEPYAQVDDVALWRRCTGFDF